MVASAPAATVARHWSGLFGNTFQPGRNGAAMSAWICVLTLEGTGIVFARTSRGVSASSARPPPTAPSNSTVPSAAFTMFLCIRRFL